LRFLWLGLLLLLFLLFLLLGGCALWWPVRGGLSSDGPGDGLARCLCQALCLVLDGLSSLAALISGQRGRCGARRNGIGDSGLLLLLLALLLGLCVDGLDLEDDAIDINVDLVIQLQAEDGRVLNKVDMSDDVVVALLAGALLCTPLGDDGREFVVEGDVCDRGLCAEERGPAREMRVQ
jgi:hypothetical protein